MSQQTFLQWFLWAWSWLENYLTPHPATLSQPVVAVDWHPEGLVAVALANQSVSIYWGSVAQPRHVLKHRDMRGVSW